MFTRDDADKVGNVVREFNRMYADVAGRVPVTTDGDKVARMDPEPLFNAPVYAFAAFDRSFSEKEISDIQAGRVNPMDLPGCTLCFGEWPSLSSKVLDVTRALVDGRGIEHD